MHTFAQKPKETQSATVAKTSAVVRANVAQVRESNSLLNLDSTMGNQAELRIRQRGAEERDTRVIGTTAPRSGSDFSRIRIAASDAGVIQTKLAVNTPGDEYENEAERVADHVMNVRDAGVAPRRCGGDVTPLSIQRMCTSCSKEYATADQEGEVLNSDDVCPKCKRGTTVQAKHLPGQVPRVSSEVESYIHRLNGLGRPLDLDTRSFFESRFGYDFSPVRVHHGGEAAIVSRSINARAFTIGNNLVFGEGEYAPESTSGRYLLAHELTHVIQQGGARRSLQRSAQEVGVHERQAQPGLARQCEVGPGPFPGDGLAPPGDCSWATYLPLLAAKESAAAVVAGLGACRGGDSCNTLALKIAAISAEIAARMAREAKCFRGGDRGHRVQICDKVNMLMRCYRFFQNSNCSQELVEAMEVVVTTMRAAIVVGAAALTVALVVALIAAIVALVEVIIAALAGVAAAAAEAILEMLVALAASLA